MLRTVGFISLKQTIASPALKTKHFFDVFIIDFSKKKKKCSAIWQLDTLSMIINCIKLFLVIILMEVIERILLPELKPPHANYRHPRHLSMKVSFTCNCINFFYVVKNDYFVWNDHKVQILITIWGKMIHTVWFFI